MWIYLVIAALLLIVVILVIALKKELEHEEREALRARAASHPTTIGGGLPSWRLYDDDPTYR
jgi:hypothetical protein